MWLFHSLPALALFAGALLLAWLSNHSRWRELCSAVCLGLYAFIALLTLTSGGSLHEALAYLLPILVLLMQQRRTP